MPADALSWGMRQALAYLVLCLSALPAFAQDFEVIDGDTLKAPWSERFRIVGIDAPELGQQCERNATPYPCGQEARQALTRLLRGKEVVCASEGKDRYGRTLAVCYADGEDVGGAMVGLGWALAYRRYSTAYVAAEDEARAGKRGMWAGRFTEPWAWRAEQRN